MAEQGSTQYGGFWIRFLAYAVDGVILWIATVGLVVACIFLGAAGAILAGIIPLLLPLLYFVFMQASARQATFGKALLGMKVTSVSGERISFLRSLARELSKFVSAIPLAIGFLMAAFTGRKQGLHDMMASTVVPREGQSHVVAALAVVVVGYLGPVILVFFMGVGILAGVMSAMGGSMLGGMMSEPAKQAAKPAPAAPAPQGAPATAAPAPAAPAAATAADVDKLLVPLTGLDKPGTTRAGPAVLELSTFFGGSDPKVWIKVHAPLAVSRATVVVTQVADAANQSHYDPKNKFETEFFQGVQLSETRSGTPRMEGLRSVNLTAGTTEQQVQKIDGVLKLVVPVGVKTLSFRSADAGKEQAVGAVKVKLLSIKADSVELDIGKARDNVIQFRGFGAKGEPLAIQATSRGSSTVTANFAGPMDKAEADIAAEVAERSYPFTLTRGPVAAPVAAAAPAPAPAPKPVAVVEKPAPAPAPVKVAAAAPPPVEAAPKPKPAPRKRAAAPARTGGFSGQWINEDPNTPSITRVEISAVMDGNLKIRIWGKCSPTDCDWGETTVPAQPGQDGGLSPTWNHGFATDQQHFTLLPGGRLQVKGDVRFKDKSGRVDRTYTDVFLPAVDRSSPAAPAVPAALSAPARKAATQPKYGDLMTAALNRDAAGIAELLEFGKWADKPDRRGWTPLMASAMLGDTASAERLLQAGADASKAEKIAQEKGDKAMLALLARYPATSRRPPP